MSVPKPETLSRILGSIWSARCVAFIASSYRFISKRQAPIFNRTVGDSARIFNAFEYCSNAFS